MDERCTGRAGRRRDDENEPMPQARPRRRVSARHAFGHRNHERRRDRRRSETEQRACDHDPACGDRPGRRHDGDREPAGIVGRRGRRHPGGTPAQRGQGDADDEHRDREIPGADVKDHPKRRGRDRRRQTRRDDVQERQCHRDGDDLTDPAIELEMDDGDPNSRTGRRHERQLDRRARPAGQAQRQHTERQGRGLREHEVRVPGRAGDGEHRDHDEEYEKPGRSMAHHAAQQRTRCIAEPEQISIWIGPVCPVRRCSTRRAMAAWTPARGGMIQCFGDTWGGHEAECATDGPRDTLIRVRSVAPVAARQRSRPLAGHQRDRRLTGRGGT